MKFLLTIFLSCVVNLTILGQAAMSNDDVVGMVAAGLGESIIITKIKNSTINFDLSTPALIKLSEAKVPELVIKTMLDEQHDRQAYKATQEAKDNQMKSRVNEQGTLADLKGMKRVFVITSSIKARSAISKELTKAGFVLADKGEDAEFAVVYSEESVNVATTYGGGAIRDLNRLNGSLTVFTVSKDPNLANRRRDVYSVAKSKYYVFEEYPAKNCISQFIKDLNKALQ